MMDAPRTGAFLLVQLLVPVSCGGAVFIEPVTCFLLDGFLLIYAIIATALYIREKLYSTQYVAVAEVPEDNRVYQELERLTEAEPYQVLEPSKRKKKAHKKKKSQSSQANEGNHGASLSPDGSASPSSPH